MVHIISLLTVAKVEKRKFDFATLNQNRTKPKPKLFDEGKGTLKVWRVENFELKEVAAKDVGSFYSGDCYVLLYSYKDGTQKKYVIYYWLVSTYMRFFIRTSKFWSSLIVLKFLHVRYSFDFLFCSLSVSNCRKTCKETLHVMT